MSGNPAMVIVIPIIFFLLFIYGLLIINIPIGIFWGIFCLLRHKCLQEEFRERNLQVCGNAFISAIPLCGPIIAFWRLSLL